MIYHIQDWRWEPTLEIIAAWVHKAGRTRRVPSQAALASTLELLCQERRLPDAIFCKQNRTSGEPEIVIVWNADTPSLPGVTLIDNRGVLQWLSGEDASEFIASASKGDL